MCRSLNICTENLQRSYDGKIWLKLSSWLKFAHIFSVRDPTFFNFYFQILILYISSFKSRLRAAPFQYFRRLPDVVKLEFQKNIKFGRYLTSILSHFKFIACAYSLFIVLHSINSTNQSFAELYPKLKVLHQVCSLLRQVWRRHLCARKILNY